MRRESTVEMADIAKRSLMGYAASLYRRAAEKPGAKTIQMDVLELIAIADLMETQARLTGEMAALIDTATALARDGVETIKALHGQPTGIPIRLRQAAPWWKKIFT